ncbi:MAG: hypothetical protein WCH79_08860 [Planctomycetia bacterium]
MPRTWLSPIRPLAITAAALLTLLGTPPGVDAGLVVEFRNVTGGREGGTGSFEVVLVSSDAPVDIYGFGMQIDIAGTSVNFTGATTATTAPYLFSITGSYSYDDPTNFPLGTISSPPQSILLADSTVIPAYQTVPYTDPNNSQVTITEWALGLVLFRVPWDVTPGEFVLSVDDGASTFTTYGPAAGGGVDYNTQIPLQFTSNPSIILVVVPEATPSMLALSGLGVAGVGSILSRRRRMKSRREGLSSVR